jgi:hypothetical protein
MPVALEYLYLLGCLFCMVRKTPVDAGNYRRILKNYNLLFQVDDRAGSVLIGDIQLSATASECSRDFVIRQFRGIVDLA